jgi:competence protein ComEA
VADRPDFRPRRAAAPDPRAPQRLTAALLLGFAALAGIRMLVPVHDPGVVSVIEVTGDVPRPGLHEVPALTVRAALEAAGADPSAFPDQPVRSGDRVQVDGASVRVLPPSDPLLVGLPLDLNEADAVALAAVPGLSDAQADAIVAWRDAHGPFATLADVEAVPGVGPATCDRLAPFVRQPRR